MMEFKIRKAEMQDLDEIMEIMDACKKDMENPEWFVADDKYYVKEYIQEKGFIVVAETKNGKMAGFFIIKCQGQKDELTRFLSYSDKKARETVIMDSAAVRKEFRGNSLQKKMLLYAEQLLDKSCCHYLICTVHPQNLASLKSMQESGYKIKNTVKCYNGLKRHILEKEV